MWQTADYVIVVIVLSSANLPPLQLSFLWFILVVLWKQTVLSYILFLIQFQPEQLAFDLYHCFSFYRNISATWKKECTWIWKGGFRKFALENMCFRKYALMTLLLAEVKAFTQLEKIIGFHNVTKLVSYMIFFFLTWSHSYDFVSVPGALWQAVTTITMVLTNLFLVIHQLK